MLLHMPGAEAPVALPEDPAVLAAAAMEILLQVLQMVLTDKTAAAGAAAAILLHPVTQAMAETAL